MEKVKKFWLFTNAQARVQTGGKHTVSLSNPTGMPEAA